MSIPKYRVTSRSFINNGLREEGDIVEFDGIPADNLEPIDAPAEKAAKKNTAAAKAEDKQRQAAAAAGVNVSDPEAFAAWQAEQAAAAGAALV